MKKIIAIIFTVFLNLAFYSCTPAALQDDAPVSETCCGDEGTIKVPPPPPPGSGG